MWRMVTPWSAVMCSPSRPLFLADTTRSALVSWRLTGLEGKSTEQIEGIVRAGIAPEAVVIGVRPIEFEVGDVLKAQADVEPWVQQRIRFAKRDYGQFGNEATTVGTARRTARDRRRGVEAGIR